MYKIVLGDYHTLNWTLLVETYLLVVVSLSTVNDYDFP
jgi:hypothetical protein